GWGGAGTRLGAGDRESGAAGRHGKEFRRRRRAARVGVGHTEEGDAAMTEREKLEPTGTHAVGYGKPPVHTRFRKGQSGNPRGRRRGMTAGRAMALLLREAYREGTGREGESTRTTSALQAGPPA